MYNKDIIKELNRLKFEDFLWLLFAILSFANIGGDHNEVEYLKTNNNTFKSKANHIFETTLTITLLIYIYFFIRNYNAYKKSTDKELYKTKLFGSSLLIAGILCLLYFQKKQTSFTGSPAL